MAEKAQRGQIDDGWYRPDSDALWRVEATDAALMVAAGPATILALLDALDKAEAALKAWRDAEWMVTHDWGGDREAVHNQGDEALAAIKELDNGEKT